MLTTGVKQYLNMKTVNSAARQTLNSKKSSKFINVSNNIQTN